jgi:hypothetical protein
VRKDDRMSEAKAEVTEIPICRCTNEQLEALCTSAFGGKPHLVPPFVECPCGHKHAIGPGLAHERKQR